jgi:hypothetical protein
MNGAVTLWFVLVAFFTAFVAVDIRTTPEATVMKWAFVIVTIFSGPFGALLYVLSCKEPLSGTHEQFVAAKWRQVVGSTSHCVAGDGIGILAAAGVTGLLKLSDVPSVIIEYAAGFLFGWMIFQSLFMKSSMGGSYAHSTRSTFLPEFLSMNGVMAGMIAVAITWRSKDPLSTSPLHARFWFVMSMALCAGFIVSYPINWWLISRGLKHGMLTERPEEPSAPDLTLDNDNRDEHSSHSMGDSSRSVEESSHAGSSAPHSTMTDGMQTSTSIRDKFLAIMITLGILGVGAVLALSLRHL